MIRSLRVINDNYNFDSVRPSTSYDNGETTEIVRVDMALDRNMVEALENAARSVGEHRRVELSEVIITQERNGKFKLPRNNLPVGLTFELEQNIIYCVVGSNGVGKSTFLNGIKFSLQNSAIYHSTGRSALFCGDLGLSNTGRPSRAVNGVIDRTSLLNLIDFTHKPFNIERTNDYAVDAFKFYLRHEELYENPFFVALKKFNDSQLDSRLEKIIESEIKDVGSTMFKLPLVRNAIKKSFSNILDSSKQIADVKRKLIFLIEHRDSIPEVETPLNVYGQYELSLLNHFSYENLHLRYFDSRKRIGAHALSMGQYARDQLESFIADSASSGIYLLDEPTGNTDRTNSRWIRDEFFRQILESKASSTLLVATNDESLIESIARLNGLFINLDTEPARIVKYNEIS